MGATQVTVTVRNPASPERIWEGLFRVDTGAVDCLVPGNRLREIGVIPEAQRTYELADGREVRMDIAAVEIEFMGELVGSTIEVSGRRRKHSGCRASTLNCRW